MKWALLTLLSLPSLLSMPTLLPPFTRFPNPTCYRVFFSLPDLTRFGLENHRVAGNPKPRVLPNISGIPEVLGIPRPDCLHSLDSLRKGSNNQNGNLRWNFPLGVGAPPLPPYNFFLI